MAAVHDEPAVDPKLSGQLQAHDLDRTAVRTYECDIVWPDARLIVELDGYETHGTRRQFERHRARDRALTIAGWRVIRITWRQLRDEPQTLADDLRALLGAAPTASRG